MRIILDTNAFLWFVTSNPRLSARADAVLSDEGAEVVLSLASLWEIAIKYQLGKLHLADPFDVFVRGEMQHNDIHPLAVEVRHLERIATMPLHHKDPFDRLIIAQSLTEDMPVISVDSAFDAYGVQRIW